MRKIEPEQSVPGAADPGFRFLSLVTGIFLAVLLTAFPRVAMDRWGVADHPAAALLLWSMTAGFASGAGFALRGALPRLILSSPACLFALVLALLRVASH